MENDIWIKENFNENVSKFIIGKVKKNLVLLLTIKNGQLIVKYDVPLNFTRVYNITNESVRSLVQELPSSKRLSSACDLSEKTYNLQFSDGSSVIYNGNNNIFLKYKK